jgi:rhamnosyltransferase
LTTFYVLVVTYNGEQSIVRLIKHLLKAGKNFQLKILVVDNASSDATLSLLENNQFKLINLIRNNINYGIARAFNQGMEYFHKINAPWILILDQDSYIADDFFSVYEHTFTQLASGQCDSVGAICSNAISEKTKNISHLPYLWNGYAFYDVADATQQKSGIPVECGLPVVVSSISSGTFYKTSVLKELGGFREDYFIDFVDHEFHLKLLKHGGSMLWNKAANFEHNLGIKQQQHAKANWIEHPPYRYYYMARNMAHGLYCYGGFKGLSTFLKTIPAHLRMAFRYSHVPWSIVGNIARGLLDAGLGKMGKKSY